MSRSGGSGVGGVPTAQRAGDAGADLSSRWSAGRGAAGALVDGTGPRPSPEASSRAVERPGVFRAPTAAALAEGAPGRWTRPRGSPAPRPSAAAHGHPQRPPTERHRPQVRRRDGRWGRGPIRPPVTVITRDTPADAELHRRCDGAIGWRYGSAPRQRIWKRLDDELDTIRRLGFASYFLTVGEITPMVRDLGIRSAARGSGAGSLVNYLLGISGIDPIRHGLLMERFLSPLRVSLPDIDLDVESARRLEVYDAILERYGHERCATVSMMDTYKVRHAIRDVGAALGMPVGEIDTIAKAFPHIRARDARMALRDLPELRATGLAREAAAGDWGSFDMFFRLVESLDGLPRHIAMHPCGVLLSDRTLLDRTPVEQSFLGYPMSQFDKEDVEDLGLLKLDVLGIRMQSSMAHAVAEIERTEGRHIDLDDEVQVPFDDQRTFDMISSAKTLGVFQIESPGQRELVGKSGIETFEDIIADISLFRPGPVKSDMITPYLEVKNGWKQVSYLHDDLRPILERTRGVVVYHEQIIEMIATFAGVSYAEGDEWRRALGDTEGMAETRTWFFPRALGRGYPLPLVEQIWKVIESFASFGFCKAHAAAFALPTYQSAWLKAHFPAHFLAGVLTHDPGMYPKRLILDDARQLGIEVLGLDVNASEAEYVVERLETRRHDPHPCARRGGRRTSAGTAAGEGSTPSCSRGGERTRPAWMGHGWGIRIALGEVRGINDAEVTRIVGGRNAAPYASLTDFWQRAQVARPVVERLVQAGGFDSIYGIGASAGAGRRHRMTRRDLLLEIGDLDRLRRAADRASAPRARGLSRSRPKGAASPEPGGGSFQLALDLGDSTDDHATARVSGLPEMTDSDRVRAELDILGLDASRHVVEFHAPFLDRLGITRSADLLSARSRSELLVAGVKVATQTPPIRSGRRVIFLTLDDATGPVDATFFEDAQGPYAATVFGSWLLVVRGELRRTGRRGVSLRATGAWDLGRLHDLWRAEGMDAVHAEIDRTPEGYAGVGPAQGTSRVLVHTSGFRMSPYADIKPAGHIDRHGHRRGGPQAVAPQPRERRMIQPPRPPRVGRMERPLERRTAARTVVVWDAVRALLEQRPADPAGARVLDIGGGTGGFAVRLAGLGAPGHRRRPQSRRPRGAGPTGRRGGRGRPGHRPPGRPRRRRRAGAGGWRRPGAVPRRARPGRRPRRSPGHDRLGAASRGRPLPAGQPAARRRPRPRHGRPPHPGQGPARRSAPGAVDQPDQRPAERRFTADQVTGLLEGAGYAVTAVHGVRVFSDLVPPTLLDLEPGAGAALLDLERAVATRPEYLTLAAQLHTLATH